MDVLVTHDGEKEEKVCHDTYVSLLMMMASAIVMSSAAVAVTSGHSIAKLVYSTPVDSHLMPKDLPGLYWDEERSRYFPLSSRTKRPPLADTITSHHTKGTREFFDAPGNEKMVPKRRPRSSVPWHANEMNFSTESHTQRMRNSQSVLFVDLCFM